MTIHTAPYAISLVLTACSLLLFVCCSTFYEMTKVVGDRWFEKIVLGKYRHPHVEERIFMFVDLTDSTRLSHQLGARKFSRLLKDFFLEMDRVTRRYGGEVYQYAGDEVIIHWPASARHYDAAVNSFAAFYRRIEARQHSYHSRYGTVPRFKAGMHSGEIVATWVGRSKREILYQGEVLNIAARIAELAKHLSFPLLVSRAIADGLSPGGKARLHYGGAYAVKGLDNLLPVYVALCENPERNNQQNRLLQENQSEAIVTDLCCQSNNTIMNITLKAAMDAAQQAQVKAREINVAANIVVLDTAGYLKYFERMDNAYLGSIDIAIQKAKTAMLFRMPSEAVGEFLKPQAAAYGLENTNGGLVGFPGAKPIVSDSRIIGYIGVSGGAPAQDAEIASAGSAL
ncbi:heme-binding protein [Flavihumibacter petaseus]|uniref:Guanylate cyclase domain-containing protein n=1 Tax=Flavihumibacter petaseus NBRC 106054 TaxID=1220578 RepID=A0A0E9N3Z1_9BACT|nr:heme-binding protein [Flavihumibacter petaseus]GAO44085.1 hypothetical protein FPE01S_03_01250 [Flavihumibacter petaseus NBRC 106054]